MALDARTKLAIRAAVREVDPAQIVINRRLTIAERYAKMTSMIEWAETTGAYRLRLARPELSPDEALRVVRGQK
jgi:hypothetical protein